MASIYDEFQNPFNSRYCSQEMKALFSPRRRFSTWRKLWCYLAEAEKELGLDIHDVALEEMRKYTVRSTTIPIISLYSASTDSKSVLDSKFKMQNFQRLQR